ncbi:hypothetical protein ACWD4G_07540 [Streptomyces sp. NPDC002643]
MSGQPAPAGLWGYPGETEYRTFIHHLYDCEDCGYGQVRCEKATELWREFKDAEKHAKNPT